MSSNSSTWLLISFISFQKLINHHNNLRHLYRKPEVCWWWTHWTDAVYTEASHQDQDSQYCGCDHLARSPAASTRLGGGVASPDLRPPLAPDQRTPGSLYTLQATLRPATPPPPWMWWWQASSGDVCQLWCRDWDVSVGMMADLVRAEDSGGRPLALAACWLLVIVLLSLTVCPNTRTPSDFCISSELHISYVLFLYIQYL